VTNNVAASCSDSFMACEKAVHWKGTKVTPKHHTLISNGKD